MVVYYTWGEIEKPYPVAGVLLVVFVDEVKVIEPDGKSVLKLLRRIRLHSGDNLSKCHSS